MAGELGPLHPSLRQIEKQVEALRRTINESDYYQWKPALEHPAQSAAFVITSDHDAVAQAVEAHPQGLTLINIVCSTDQPCVRFYRSNLSPPGDRISGK